MNHSNHFKAFIFIRDYCDFHRRRCSRRRRRHHYHRHHDYYHHYYYYCYYRCGWYMKLSQFIGKRYIFEAEILINSGSI